MTDHTRVRLARVLGATSAVLGISGFATIELVTDLRQSIWKEGGGLTLLLCSFFAIFVWLVIPRQPRNAAVWSMAASGFGAGLYLGGHAIAALMSADPDLVLGDTFIPANVPTIASMLAGAGVIGVYVAIYAWLVFGFLLFPDGRLPGARWRWIARLAGAGLALLAAGTLWEYRPWSTTPVTENTALTNVGGATASLTAVAALASLVIRFRASTGATRDQFKWVVWGAAVMVPWFVAGFIVGGTSNEDAILIPLHISVAIMLAAFGIAVGRYRLFDIDVVISRTFVYGTLGLIITTFYVVVVAGVGDFLGGGDAPNQALALTTTAAVAIAFHPMRRRLHHMANRLVYGKRATPYEVLSAFSHRVAAADGSLLDEVSRSLVEGTGAQEAAVWVDVDGALMMASRFPDSAAPMHEGAVVFPIEQDGVVLGRLALAAPDGQRISDGDLRLAGEIASAMGLALRNQLLTRTLESRVEELRASRRRLVAVQDETRRRLERDLHDGAQQQLVALKVKLGLARTLAIKAGGPRTAAVLGGLSTEAELAVDGLRDFARGVYPPLLEAEGLTAAIASYARRLPIPVAVESDGVGRYDTSTEATIYFCIVEALQNVVRHAHASTTRIVLAESDRRLRFEVSDDGAGFDPAISGRGLSNMEIRLDAAGGDFSITSDTGVGTTVVGSVPVGSE